MKKVERQFTNITEEIDIETMKWMTYISDREALRNRESKFCENLKQLVDSEHQYRKFFQHKQLMLTDMFKNMENLLINMDKAVIQLLEKEDINMMMNDETFS